MSTTTPPPGTGPVSPALTGPLGPAANVNLAQVAAGDQVTVFGTNFPANTPLALDMFSDPVALGSASSDADGSYSVLVTIPAGTAPGAHDIVVSGGGVQASTKITVVPEPATAARGFLARTGSNPESLFWLAFLGVVIGATLLSHPGAAWRRNRRRFMP